MGVSVCVLIVSVLKQPWGVYSTVLYCAQPGTQTQIQTHRASGGLAADPLLCSVFGSCVKEQGQGRVWHLSLFLSVFFRPHLKFICSSSSFCPAVQLNLFMMQHCDLTSNTAKNRLFYLKKRWAPCNPNIAELYIFCPSSGIMWIKCYNCIYVYHGIVILK